MAESRIASSKAAARAKSVIAERARAAQHRELCDVAAEEEADRPVGDDAELSRQQGELVQVVGAGDEPAEKSSEAETEHVGDPLVAAERRDLAEHAVAVGTNVALEVL